jgi:hypothetical protein
MRISLSKTFQSITAFAFVLGCLALIAFCLGILGHVGWDLLLAGWKFGA